MSTFNLGLPTNIPWKRICVSDDMLSGEWCGNPNPIEGPAPQWRSSIAIFEYEPTGQDTTPILEDMIITYLKVSCTITPYSSSNLDSGVFGPDQFLVTEELELPSSFPCYGALLQVTVTPEDAEGVNKQDYPYFLDFEPKRRELFEAVSETGESIYGSQSEVSVGKSSTNTKTTAAPSFGLSVPIPGLPAPVGLNYSNNSNTVSSEENLINSDSSTERRETSSHTSQLSQMYNLFQAFHVGTNRAMFFIEPRPHIVSTPATFINGPRQIEGIQEVFLIVTRPKTPDNGMCVTAQLDTAHLLAETKGLAGRSVGTVRKTGSGVIKTPSGRDETDYLPEGGKRVAIFLHFGAPTDPWKVETEGVRKYLAPSGWRIVDYVIKPKNTGGTDKYAVKLTDEELEVIQTASTGYISDNIVELSIVLVPVTNDEMNFTRLFLTGRKLCCCVEVEPTILDPNSVVFDKYLGKDIAAIPQGSGIMTEDNILLSRKVSAAIRNSIIESVSSPARVPVGAVPYYQSDAFYSQVVNASRATNPSLDKPVSASELISPANRDKILAYIGDIPVVDLIQKDSYPIAKATGLSRTDVMQIKDQILRAAKPLPPPAPPANPLRNIVSVKILSSYPDANSLRVLYDMSSPQVLPTMQQHSYPNIIEVDFSGTPDAGTVTTSSFFVSAGGSSLPATVVQQTLTKYQLRMTSPLPPGVLSLTLKGTGGSAITFNSVALDGDPIAIPSGNGIAGGDFTSAINVMAAPVVPAPPSPPPTLLKIIGVRIWSTTPTTRVLFDMISPGGIINLLASDIPDRIEVDFNVAPDGGTVTSSTFKMSTTAGPFAGTVTSVSSTRFRIVPTAPFVAGTIYNVELVGTGTPKITLSGAGLDGDPIALPSGDGSAGSNFTFSFQLV